MASIVLVRHGEHPADDRVHSFCLQNGFEPVVVRPFAGERLGSPGGDVVGSVIYGGPYSVLEVDRHPFLQEEYRWIDACLARGLPLLGICQGAQQIAWHLRAEVGPDPQGIHEFGYYEISPCARAEDFLPVPIWVSQFHHHGFTIPEGAVRLAGSALFPNQAFRYGDCAYGVQFHPEVTIGQFRRWQQRASAPYGRPGSQTREEQDALMLEHDPRQAAWFRGFLRQLFGRADRPRFWEAPSPAPDPSGGGPQK